jgi:four helix bundle protein
LIAWQKAIDLVEVVYRETYAWPRDELYGLTNQTRRAAVSVPSNIAEGRGRSGAKEFLHHLSIAHGSLCELETQLVIAQRLGYADEQRHAELSTRATEVGRLINGLIRSVRSGLQEESPDYLPEA